MRTLVKRIPPIAKTLVNNSIAAMISAIEIHNKPKIKYRYEIVTLLVINSWELLLKAYIYKFLGKKSLFVDGRSETKPFLECTGLVLGNLENKYHVVRKNLEALYYYRNRFSHYHIEDINIILFALIKKNIIFYDDFIQKFFNIDISTRDDLILLPIGFKKPTSPLDYLSNESYSKSTSKEITNFIFNIIESTKELSDIGINETILSDFKINLTNENRITNADIISGITKDNKSGISFSVKKYIKNAIITDDKNAFPMQIVTPDTEDQEIASWIALSGKDTEFSWFVPDTVRLWTIYSSRLKLKLIKTHYINLIRYSLHKDIPVFYWFKFLEENEIKDIIRKTMAQVKGLQKFRILKVSAYFDKKFFYENLREVERIFDLSRYPKTSKYPSTGAGEYFQYTHLEKQKKGTDDAKYKLLLEERLSQLLKDTIAATGEPKDVETIWSLDYYIYGSN